MCLREPYQPVVVFRHYHRVRNRKCASTKLRLTNKLAVVVIKDEASVDVSAFCASFNQHCIYPFPSIIFTTRWRIATILWRSATNPTQTSKRWVWLLWSGNNTPPSPLALAQKLQTKFRLHIVLNAELLQHCRLLDVSSDATAIEARTAGGNDWGTTAQI